MHADLCNTWLYCPNSRIHLLPQIPCTPCNHHGRRSSLTHISVALAGILTPSAILSVTVPKGSFPNSHLFPSLGNSIWGSWLRKLHICWRFPVYPAHSSLYLLLLSIIFYLFCYSFQTSNSKWWCSSYLGNCQVSSRITLKEGHIVLKKAQISMHRDVQYKIVMWKINALRSLEVIFKFFSTPQSSYYCTPFLGQRTAKSMSIMNILINS